MMFITSTIEERLYYAELAKGRYLISKTLNELETELNPAQFFRIKRDYIVNRQAVVGYTHWENGKYIVRLNPPSAQTISIPRSRMQELREWLQQADINFPEPIIQGSFSDIIPNRNAIAR